MTRDVSFFRDHTLALSLGAGVLIAVFTLGFIAVLMARAGASLKPILFFAVFIGIIAGPQVAYHALRAAGKVPDLNRTATPPAGQLNDSDEALVARDGRFLRPDLVFGPGFDPTLRSDVRRLFPSAVAEVAEMTIFRNGQSAIAARFADRESAVRASRTYAAQLTGEMPKPDESGAYTVRRVADWARLLVAGRTVFIWSSLDPEGLNARQTASAACWQATTLTPKASAESAARTAQSRAIAVWSVVGLAVLATVWFFKGSSWAATIRPQSAQHLPASAGELTDRLLQIDRLRQPVSVRPGANPHEIEVTWRFDGGWRTLASVHQLQRIHRLTLHLDEADHTVRVEEHSAEWSFDAAPDAAALRWKAKRGITFFEYQRERVFGVAFDPSSGMFTAVPGYEYTFNLQELKAPVIEAALAAGWTWKPVLWGGPSWLRWLTE